MPDQTNPNSQENQLVEAVYGVNPATNPKAVRSSERGREGDVVTVVEPVTTVDPNLRGEAQDTAPNNPARLSHTELSGVDPAQVTAEQRNEGTAARTDAIVRQQTAVVEGNAYEDFQRDPEANASSVEEQRAVKNEANRQSVSGETPNTQTKPSGFDPSNPENTTLSELEAAIANSSQQDIETARKKDSRVGAKEIYSRALDGGKK